MEEPDEKNYQICVFFFTGTLHRKNMAPPILLGFNFSLVKTTHPMSQGIRSNQFIVAKIPFLRIKAAMKNEYIETKGKYNATKVEGSV